MRRNQSAQVGDDVRGKIQPTQPVWVSRGAGGGTGMADIFISHSGQDNEAAAALGERIRRERPTWSLFYDKDNIRAGQRWQERLREELQSCRVVLALLSRNWLGSAWCFAEAVTASFRGKDVVGIETEDFTAEDLAARHRSCTSASAFACAPATTGPGRRSWRRWTARGSTRTTGSRSHPVSGPILAWLPSTKRMPACSSAASRRSPSIWASSTAARPGPFPAAGHLGCLGQRQVLAAARWPYPSPASEARVGRDQPVRGRARARAQPAGPNRQGARQSRHPCRGSTSQSPDDPGRSPRSWMRRCGGWSRPLVAGCCCRWIRRKLWYRRRQAGGPASCCSTPWPRFSAGDAACRGRCHDPHRIHAPPGGSVRRTRGAAAAGAVQHARLAGRGHREARRALRHRARARTHRAHHRGCPYR